MAKKNNKMSIEKKMKKNGRILVLETAADYLYTWKNSFRAILERENKTGYIVDDWRVNADSIFNMSLIQSPIDEEGKRLLGGLVHALISLPLSKDRNKVWNKATETLAEFKKKFSVVQYFSMARQIINNYKYPWILSPLWMTLDYEYFSEGLILGDNGKSIITQTTYFKYDGVPCDIPFCYFSSVDNIVEDFEGLCKVCLIQDAYLQLIGITNDTYIRLFGPEKSVEYVCSVAKYCSINTSKNKFMFSGAANISSADIQFVATKTFNKSLAEEEAVLESIFIEMYSALPADILARRKYIFVNTAFPHFKYDPLTLVPNHGDREYIENVRIREVNEIRTDGNYYMIYMEYTFAGIKRVLPVCIDNFIATVGNSDIVDKQAFLLLLSIYGLADEIPESVKTDNTYKHIYAEIEEITRTFNYCSPEIVTHEHSSGYHQTKEVHVDAFVRRLPAGQKASEQAKELAKQYRVNLGEDHTIVSPYIRNKKKAI